jgi:hypothetical protein
MFSVSVRLFNHIADLLNLVRASFQKSEIILLSFILCCFIKIFYKIWNIIIFFHQCLLVLVLCCPTKTVSGTVPLTF